MPSPKTARSTTSTDQPLSPRFRFAPSPNGALHLGHALSACLNAQQAKASGGTFLLRIEDIDIGRSRAAHIDGIFTDLAWLGLSWAQPVLQQSSRFAAYRQAAARLDEMGLLYPCFATRKDIERAALAKAAVANQPIARDPDGAILYPRLHKDLPHHEIERRKNNGEPFALRLDMARALKLASASASASASALEAASASASASAQQNAIKWPLTFIEQNVQGLPQIVAVDPACWGDIVIMRKDVDASYHLAVVVDDAYQRITHVTRGADLAASTHIHVLLQALLAFDHPTYHHHRLLTNAAGEKLSKSAGAQSLKSLRQAGRSAQDIRSMIRLDNL